MKSARGENGIGKRVFLGLKDCFVKRKRLKSGNNYLRLKEKNKVLLAEDIREKRHVLRAYPPFIGLGTDSRCNLRCIMCVQRLEDRKTLMDAPTIEEKYFIKFAEEVFPTAETLQLNTAGEPLMSRNFDLELEMAAKFQVQLDVITNGLLLNSKKGQLQQLCNNAKAIQFSFDSPVLDTYESIRVGSDFKKVVENMRLLQKYRAELPAVNRPFFGINMVVMKRNLSELQEMVRFAKDIGVDHLGFASIHIHSEAMEEESLVPVKQEVNRSLLAAKALADSLGVKITIPPLDSFLPEVAVGQVGNSIPSRTPEVEPEINRCPFLWNRTYLDNEANVFVCCEPSHPVAGSIQDQDFKAIWNGEIYEKMRRTFTGGPPDKYCERCARVGYLSKINPF